MARTITVKMNNPIYIYPWGNAYVILIEAFESIERKLRSVGIDIYISITNNKGIPVLSGNHFTSRGMWNGSALWLHSGLNPHKANDYKAPFKDIDAIARIALHEIIHSLGGIHSNDKTDLMHSDVGDWPRQGQYSYTFLADKCGTISIPPKTEKELLTEQLTMLKSKRLALRQELIKINDEITRIDNILQNG